MGMRGPTSLRLATARNAARGKPVKREPWEARGLRRLERVVKFCLAMPITKGIKADTMMKLLPDQLEFLTAVYGRDGDDRVRLAVKSAPRGNGKTGLAAALCLCHLLGPEAEKRGEVYSAAVDRPQATIMFHEMVAIIYAVPSFAARCNILRHSKRIEVLSGPGEGSIYESMSSDARRAHGLSPSFWVYDEMAQVADRELLDNLQTAMGKRKRSLGLIISTQAPDDQHALSQIIDDGIAREDPAIVVHLLAASSEDDPFDHDVIRKVNPALGIFLQESDIFSEAERAKNIPAFQSKFQNLRLNQRIDADTDERLCHALDWRLCNKPVDRHALRGKKCFAALDLSAKHDLTSLTLVFPDNDYDPTFDILQWFWTPKDELDRRSFAEMEKLKNWIRLGYITPVPGPVVRFNFIAMQLIELAKEFEIQAIAYDAWRIEDFMRDLAAIDPNFPVPLDKFGQGFKSMTPAVEAFIDLVKHGKLRHGNNPALTACVVNAVLEIDPAEGKKINKPKSRGRGPIRVDGAVTLCMALELAKRWVAGPKIDPLAMVA